MRRRGRPVVNMVMSSPWPSAIFSDLLGRFVRGLPAYCFRTTIDPLSDADLYHYWRPHLAGTLRHPSLVVLHHDLERDLPELRLDSLRPVISTADAIVCLNDRQRRLLRDSGIQPCVVIPHGQEARLTARVTAKPHRGVTIGFVSKRYPRLVKGEPTLHAVIRALRYDHCVRWVFVGEGRHHEGRLCRQLGVSHEVYERIAYRRLIQLYSRLDVLLITSEAEGGPASLPEAMACGVPAISTPCGMAPDLIRHEENGWLFEYGDWRAMSGTIEMIRREPEKLRRMGERARKSTQSLAWQSVLGEYAALYRDLVEGSYAGGSHQER